MTHELIAMTHVLIACSCPHANPATKIKVLRNSNSLHLSSSEQSRDSHSTNALVLVSELPAPSVKPCPRTPLVPSY